MGRTVRIGPSRLPDMRQGVCAVFFDFGGTLFSYSDLARNSFRPMLEEAMARLAADASLKRAGQAYNQATGEAIRDFSSKPSYLHRDLFRDTFRRFALALSCEPDDDFLDWFLERQRTMFFEGCKLRSDCLETLAALRARGIYLAIVSNIDDDYLFPMVEKVGLDRVLDAWTSSEEAESCKPDGAIFAYCLQKAGVTAEQVCFVGDSLVHDIAGARRAGMQTVWIREPGQGLPGTVDDEAIKADLVIEELAELLPMFPPDPH